MDWTHLGFAIVAKIVGRTALKASDGSSKLGSSLVAVVGFIVALYFLEVTLRTLQLAVAYAICASAGTALLTIVGVVIFRQSLDFAGWVGVLQIVAGVVVIKTLSKTEIH
ncbi:DMT family transporter [Tateyamaria omphalii]|uniref:QacE family quaternary ammonium compound efflux SMR transporter n=1 Tax=Tateyamaria omphalii TaxID=299262 RepID=A0A1P8MVB0_9RHOB|nr:SMR family transporter [Tateyamaria omphalii]APX11968.1 QacE family quaternary ammonium compound efflux SMR transporter [Tateyamaria omphalii]